MQPLRDATIPLRDGRTLAYCEWGDARGPAVFAFHGAPGSRVWWPGEAETLAAGARLVTVDRPGCGRSTPLLGRPIAGWASDVVELTETLGIDRFGVVGWSGGAPYAAAVAAALPDRLTGVCLANSASITYAVGPTVTDDEDAHIVEMIDLLGPIEATRRYAEEQRAWAEGCVQDPPSLIDPGEMPEGDRWLFDEPELVAGFIRSMVEGLRQGAIGEATHAIGLLSPWGFSLDEIRPAVHLWHGAQDRSVDLPDFERVATRIRDHTLTVWPDAGHFGLAKHWDSVLEAALG